MVSRQQPALEGAAPFIATAPKTDVHSGRSRRRTGRKTNPYSSASPFSDGVRVYASQGNAGLYTYDLDGNEIWKRDLGTDYAHIWGPNAASPIVRGDTLIIHAGPGLAVALFGLDKNTGETLWKKELPTAVSNDVGQFKGSWATPLLIENAGSTEMLIGL
ncbi:MAG: PQQ-binding-like beta-propeller repeat protein, partial [Verrucomicrobiales bacterium]|nr:PQQ-binding-like beta-propeller repeat protein [Verrucomicrobiales bacterium]